MYPIYCLELNEIKIFEDYWCECNDVWNQEQNMWVYYSIDDSEGENPLIGKESPVYIFSSFESSIASITKNPVTEEASVVFDISYNYEYYDPLTWVVEDIPAEAEFLVTDGVKTVNYSETFNSGESKQYTFRTKQNINNKDLELYINFGGDQDIEIYNTASTARSDNHYIQLEQDKVNVSLPVKWNQNSTYYETFMFESKLPKTFEQPSLIKELFYIEYSDELGNISSVSANNISMSSQNINGIEQNVDAINIQEENGLFYIDDQTNYDIVNEKTGIGPGKYTYDGLMLPWAYDQNSFMTISFNTYTYSKENFYVTLPVVVENTLYNNNLILETDNHVSQIERKLRIPSEEIGKEVNWNDVLRWTYV